MKLTLSRKQRDQFFAGHWPTIKGEGICPIAAGHVYRLSPLLWFEVERIRLVRGGWKLEYVVFDQRTDRSRYLAPSSHKVALDSNGEPLPQSKDDELGYTSNRIRAIEDAPAVSAEYQNLLTFRSKAEWAGYMETDRPQEVAERQTKQLVNKLRRLQLDAAKLGVDLTPRLVEMVREAERELGEKRRAA